MRYFLPALSLPTLVLPKRQTKQHFQVGDIVYFRLYPTSDWYEEEIMGVKRYKLLGVIKYKISYSSRKQPIVSQRRLIKLQKDGAKDNNPPEAEVVKPKRRLFSTVEGKW